jgi:hypothetical protein
MLHAKTVEYKTTLENRTAIPFLEEGEAPVIFRASYNTDYYLVCHYWFVPFKTVNASGTAQTVSCGQERPAWKPGATMAHKMKWDKPL